MITLNLQHLFNTDPNSTKVPRKVADWVIAKQKEFPIQYEISFWPYKNDQEKEMSSDFEKIFFSICGDADSPGDVMNVRFLLLDGCWLIRLIGARLEDGTLIPFTDQDNPKHENSKALGKKRAVISGLQEYFDKKDPLLVIITSSNEGHEKVWDTQWGYKKSKPTDPTENDMVDVSCDRNVNDEWEFRGSVQEFEEQVIKPLQN